MRKLLQLAFVALLLVQAAPSYADAVGGGNPAASGEIQTLDAGGSQKSCSDYGTLTGAIVPCVMYTVETAGEQMAIAFVDLLEPTIMSFLVLVITFFGVKIMQGEGQVAQRGMLLVIKIAFVLGFLQIMPSTIPMAHDIMKESSAIVAGALADEGSFTCEVGNFMKPDAGDDQLLWAQMDCLLGKLFGFVVGSNGQPNMLLAASGLGLLSGFLFAGNVGIFIFLALLGLLYTMFMFVVKTMFAYLNSFILATLLIIIAPLFIPLALMQASAQYFDKWWKGILAALIMPVMISSYVMMSLMLYDKVLFAEDSTVQQLFNEETMQEFQIFSRMLCTSMVSQSSDTGNAVAEHEGDDEATRAGRDTISDAVSGTMGRHMNCAEASAVDIDAMAEDMEGVGNRLEGMFVQILQLLIVAVVISQGFKIVQESVRNITGSSMVSSAVDPVSTMEMRMNNAIQSANQGFRGATTDLGTAEQPRNVAVGGLSGTDFLRGVPDLFTGAARGFGDGMKRE